jgi:hypothetical protein
MALSIPIISEFQGGGVDKAIKQFQQLDGVGAKTSRTARSGSPVTHHDTGHRCPDQSGRTVDQRVQ